MTVMTVKEEGEDTKVLEQEVAEGIVGGGELNILQAIIMRHTICRKRQMKYTQIKKKRY